MSIIPRYDINVYTHGIYFGLGLEMVNETLLWKVAHVKTMQFDWNVRQ